MAKRQTKRRIESAIRARLQLLINAKATAKAGWFDQAKYEDGTPVAYVAAIHEHGVPENNLKARPFMRPAIVQNQPRWRQIAKEAAKDMIKGQGSVEALMAVLGGQAVIDIGAQLDNMAKDLAESTIKQKQQDPNAHYPDRPLIRYKIMRNTLTSIVESEDH